MAHTLPVECFSLNNSTSYLSLCVSLNSFCYETSRIWAWLNPETRCVISVKSLWIQVLIKVVRFSSRAMLFVLDHCRWHPSNMLSASSGDQSVPGSRTLVLEKLCSFRGKYSSWQSRRCLMLFHEINGWMMDDERIMGEGWTDELMDDGRWMVDGWMARWMGRWTNEQDCRT